MLLWDGVVVCCVAVVNSIFGSCIPKYITPVTAPYKIKLAYNKPIMHPTNNEHTKNNNTHDTKHDTVHTECKIGTHIILPIV